MYSSKFYRKSPIWVQHLLVSIWCGIRKFVREGKSVERDSASLQLLEHDRSKLDVYRAGKLNEILQVASQQCDFYKELNLDLAVNLYPVLTKQTVQKQANRIQNHLLKGVKVWGSTSGTTGTPVKIPQTLQSVRTERAFILRHRSWASYQSGDRRAWLRGDKVVPLQQQSPPYWRYSYFDNTIMFSAFHMTPDALPLYIEAMIEYKTAVIQANPSVILVLAKYLEKHNLFYPKGLKSIITSSENLTQLNKKLIEERFQCVVFDWYGLFERVAAIASCEHGRYHVLQDYAHVEFVADEYGNQEIVGTGFGNTAFPLIRYKTGDFVTLSEETQCPCGRVYPLVQSINGRLGDYLLSVDNKRVFFLSHLSKGLIGLNACQYIQKQRGEIQVLVVAEPEFDQSQQGIFVNNIREKLGPQVKVELQFVTQIPRTANGKVRQAICDVRDE